MIVASVAGNVVFILVAAVAFGLVAFPLIRARRKHPRRP